MSSHGIWKRDTPVYRARLLTAPFVFFASLAVLGIFLSLGRLITGLWFTGMNDDYAWGVWKTFNVMTLTALGSGGLAVGLFTYIFGKTQLHPIMRTAVSSSILFYATGMFALCIDVGRPWNMYNLLMPWRWNLHSSLLEVAACMTAYVVLFLSFENVAPVLDNVRKPFPRVRKTMVKLYPWMVAGALVLPAMHQSSLGSLMVIAGPKVHPLWQTQMLPALYLVQAVICGFAAVIFILLASSLAWKRRLDLHIVSELAKFMSWTILVFIGLRYIDVIFRGVLAQAFQLTWYALLFHVENLLVLVPALYLLNAKCRTMPRFLFASAISAGLGGMLYRFSPTTLAYRAGHPSVYFPKIAELLMCLGYIGLAVTLFIWASKRFAIIPGTIEDWDEYVATNER